MQLGATCASNNGAQIILRFFFSHEAAQIMWANSSTVGCEWVFKEAQTEPRHDKTNKMIVCPAKTQISLGIHQVWSVFAVRRKKSWVLSYPLSAQRRLIRLGGCPGWSQSSLVAHSFCFVVPRLKCKILRSLCLWVGLVLNGKNPFHMSCLKFWWKHVGVYL